MKILKESGSYLQEQAKLSRNVAIIFLLIGGGLLYTFVISFFELFVWQSIIYIFAIVLSIGGFFLKSYMNYSKGHDAEKLVAEYLLNFDDKYYLINDVKLPNSYGNIDHVILGPNGLFVIETKKFEGQIRCEGDSWYQYKPDWKIPVEYQIKSPSKQVKGNALILRNFIESKNIFKNTSKFWIDGIVVFANNNVELHINNPTVPTMKIDDLYNYIKNKQSRIKFSSRELELIGKVILESGGN